MPNAPAIGWRNGFRSPARKSIDWTHPMTADLLAFHVPGPGGSALDLGGRFNLPALSTVPTYGATQFGTGLVNAAVNQGAALSLNAGDALLLQPPVTLMFAGAFQGAPSDRAFIYGTSYSSADLSPFKGCQLNAINFGNDICFGFNDAGSGVDVNGSASSWVGSRVFVATLTTSASAVWSNGARMATGAGAASINYNTSGSNAQASVMAEVGTSRTLNATFAAGAIWNRALSDAEILRVSADPFLFLRA
jgi:hypothetical protein